MLRAVSMGDRRVLNVPCPDSRQQSSGWGWLKKQGDLGMSINIFPARSQTAADILSGENMRKVLVVPIDFAKGTHVAQIAMGTGEFLQRRPLNVHNNEKGAEYLLMKVENACAKYRIRKKDVIFGGEDPAEYVWNFILRIQQAGYTFVRVNAKEAKTHRSNQRSTSDKLALSGIAQAILLRRSYDINLQDEVFGSMKRAERTRRRLKRMETAAQNRIYKYMDILLPGFLKEKQSGCLPFGSASLELMESGISVVRIRRMRQDTLVRRLRKNRVHNPEDAARKLKELAAAALEPPVELVPYLEKSLVGKVKYLRILRENIDMEENEMARALAQTDGFLVTTIPGVGVVLGAGIVAEYGDPQNWPSPDRMASYAGIVVRHYQSGGPDSEPIPGRLPRDANHQLKDQLLQAAFHTGSYKHPAWGELQLPGEHPLFEHYRNVELREGCSRLSTAKKLLRTVSAMMRDRAAYMPHSLLHPPKDAPMQGESFARYLELVSEMLQRKWKNYDLSGIPEERNMLHKWLKETAELIDFIRKTNR